jgi:hypothetical protein
MTTRHNVRVGGRTLENGALNPCFLLSFGSVPALDGWEILTVEDSPAARQQKLALDISLSDTNGADLYIQPLNVCLNGIPGTMYFLCSNFVPDQP